MKILFITERFPFPLHDGGNLRTYHLLRGLSEHHDVSLLSHGFQDEQRTLTDSLPQLAHVTLVRKPSVAKRLALSCIKLGMHRYPLFVLKNWSEPLLSAADKLLAQDHFDAIHFNHLDTACYSMIRDWPQAKVFDTHNCLSELAAQAASVKGRWLRQAMLVREAGLLAKFEAAVCRHMQLNLVCSIDDEAAFVKLDAGESFSVVPNGVDCSYFSCDGTSPTEPGAIVFTGAMDYYPNAQAVLFFCDHVLPLLADCHPPVRFYVVGRDPTSEVKSRHDGQRVIVTGRVTDVRPYLGRAEVVVVPLQQGSGTRLKILEAFSMGKAVVSTKIGAQGIATRHGEHLFLADAPTTIASRIKELICSAEQRQSMGQAARTLAEGTFDWRHIHNLVREAYASMGPRPEPLLAVDRSNTFSEQGASSQR